MNAADTARKIAQSAEVGRNAAHAMVLRRVNPDAITAKTFATAQFELGRLSVAENYLTRHGAGHSHVEALRFARACHRDIREQGYMCPDFNAGAHAVIGELDA